MLYDFSFQKNIKSISTSLPVSLVLTVVDNGVARGSKYCDTLAGATPVGTTTVQGIEWTVGAVLAIDQQHACRRIPCVGGHHS